MNAVKALVVVDFQKDFCPGGALPVSRADKIIPKINRYIEFFFLRKLPVIFTRDWHPKATSHFKKHGGLWPVHCVQGTGGAMFPDQLAIPQGAIILSKGMGAKENSYSSFDAKNKKKESFLAVLRRLKVKEIFVCGLATDYCVKYTVLEALKNKFKVFVLTDAIKAVNLKKSDAADALQEMSRAGAVMSVYGKARKIL